MNDTRFQIAIEELAFAMGVLGGTDVAGGFLVSLLGNKSSEALDERLTAASHSLVSRGYMSFDLEHQTMRLDEGFGSVVGFLLHNDFSIRCSRVMRDKEVLLTYFFEKGTFVEHKIMRVVSSSLEIVSDPEEVLKRTTEFFSIGGTDPAMHAVASIGTINAELPQQARDLAQAGSRERGLTLLEAAGLSTGVATNLLTDLLDMEFLGSASRIANEDGQLIANRGFLVLKGQQRLWILNIVPTEPPMLELLEGSRLLYHDLFRALLKEDLGEEFA